MGGERDRRGLGRQSEHESWFRNWMYGKEEMVFCKDRRLCISSYAYSFLRRVKNMKTDQCDASESGLVLIKSLYT